MRVGPKRLIASVSTMGSGMVMRWHVSPGIGACNSASPISDRGRGATVLRRRLSVCSFRARNATWKYIIETGRCAATVCLVYGAEKNRVPDFILYGRQFVLTSDAKHNLETHLIGSPSKCTRCSFKAGKFRERLLHVSCFEQF